MMCANVWVSFSSYRLIWTHWIYKMFVRYILSSMSTIKPILSISLYAIYGAVCFQFNHFLMTVRIFKFHLIINVDIQIWIISVGFLALGNDTMVCTACLYTCHVILICSVLSIWILLYTIHVDAVGQEYNGAVTYETQSLQFTVQITWWRHQMKTFSALLAICAGKSPVSGELPAQRPVTRSFDAFFDLRLNKRLSKQSWGWWFETLSCPLWRHRNEYASRKRHLLMLLTSPSSCQTSRNISARLWVEHVSSLFLPVTGRMSPTSSCNQWPRNTCIQTVWNPYQRLEAKTKWLPFYWRHFQVHESSLIFIQISMKFPRNGSIDNGSALVQILVWRRSGNESFF